MDISRTSDLWWKNAVFYCLDVETFQDGNGDGVGDFRGLARRIDHLAHLGVTCLWLMPFYPTANRDDGYDITDYYSVDPRLGSAGDFVEFVRTATDRGIRVIADLVVNHTSREHPWFAAARSNRESPFRDWYVWRDEAPTDGPTDLVFPGEQESNWEWDEEAGQFYLHRFYKHQPDLNIANPQVREEIRRIIGFWMQMGLSGFRVDAVPYLLETTGIAQPMSVAPHDWLRELRSFMTRRRGDAILLGEVNLPYQDTLAFFGGDGGDELTMCLDFNLNQAMALSMARQEAGPLVHAIRSMPALPESCAWAQFVRNHDEWTLDKLTEAERMQVFAEFGPEPDMQIFGRGLRRRMPTMLKGNMDRLRMIYSLAFSLPGAPVLFYGEEIGMAENLDIPGRMAVRAPMQWTAGRNGGFSSADPERLRRQPVSGRWGPDKVNVASQARHADSMLAFMQDLVRARRRTPEIVFGKCEFVPASQGELLALRYDWGERTAVIVHNLSGKKRQVQTTLRDSATWKELVPELGGARARIGADGAFTIDLEPWGLGWFRVARGDEPQIG